MREFLMDFMRELIKADPMQRHTIVEKYEERMESEYVRRTDVPAVEDGGAEIPASQA